ncbi:hypothetical protein TNCV_167271 [Trichonephila clavipes]|nr:hypothetical protein TNCV_167271 [Trichonephila clavipes]
MGGRRSPVATVILYLPVVVVYKGKREFRVGSTDSMAGEAVSLHCSLLANRLQNTARTLKRMIFRVVRSTYLKVGARILDFPTPSSARKTLHCREATSYPRSASVALSLPFQS